MAGMSALIRRALRLIALALVPLLLPGCEQEPNRLFDGDPTTPVQRDALYPKIVLQTLPTNGVEIAAWTPDDKFIITAVGQTRTVAIWEVATGNIVDRLQLPADEADASVVRRLSAMDVADDGRTVIIDAETAYFGDNHFNPTRRARYELDLVTRKIAKVDAPESGEDPWRGEDIDEVTNALEILYEDDDGDEDRTPEWYDQFLLPLPASHDGKWELRRFAKSQYDLPDGSPAEGGLELVSTVPGVASRKLVHPPMVKAADADLSPDGRWFAMIDDKMHHESDDDPGTSPMEIFDIENAEFQRTIMLPGDYGAVQWLDAERVLVTADVDMWDQDEPDSEAALADALVIHAESGVLEMAVPGRCFMVGGPDDQFFGAGVDNCAPSELEDPATRRIERLDIETQQWQPFSDLVLEGYTVISDMTLSPDGSRLGVVTTDEADERNFHLIDAETGEVLLSRVQAAGTYPGYIQKIAFSSDNSRLLISVSTKVLEWNLDEDELMQLPLNTLDTTLMADGGELMVVGGISDDAVALYDFKNGQQVGALDYGNITAGGFVPDKPLFWAFSEAGGVRIWDTRDWTELLSAYFFYNQGFMAVTPQGRYDSNIHPYRAQFRWLAPDAPFQSLNSDTFLRDYYTPGVGWRWLACSVEENCEEAFDPVKSITELNRTLPVVAVTKVEQSATDPAKAVVTVEITEGVNPEAANEKAKSGIYNPRIFRDQQLTIDYGAETFSRRFDLEQWRESQKVEQVDGKVVLTSEITLPTHTPFDEREVLISAYAFNEDRLKSETAEFRYTLPVVEQRPRRAFIVSIGIDHYRETRLNLSYAGADARLMSERLGQIPGYDTRRLAIATAGNATDARQAGNPDFVTKDTVLSVLAILAGQNREATLRKLEKQGIDASELEQTTPDDLVILSYSGHGWADQGGEFFIVPSEASWADGSTTPQTSSLLSSLELAAALKGIDAGEMVLIIDACHSGASVDDGTFKPGPMGDPGLGQLAFDKGVRILSATQADDVALEDSRLRQGLLTFALAEEGLKPTGGWADIDEDQFVDLNEWLAYAVWRLPLLSEDVKIGNVEVAARGVVFFDEPNSQSKPKLQKPSLFDFNVKASSTILQVPPR